MNRLAKGIRVANGLVLFINIAAFFLPLTQIVKGAFGEKSYTPFSVVLSVFTGEKLEELTQNVAVIILLLLLPAVMSLVTGIFAIVGGAKQIITGILSVVICGLYVTLAAGMGNMLWLSEHAEWWSYDRSYGIYIVLVSSGIAALLGIISFFVRPRVKNKKADAKIPQYTEIRGEQERERYNIVASAPRSGDESAHVKPNIQEPSNMQGEQPAPPPQTPAYDPSNPRGVVVGLTGMYAGAEISMVSGEKIKLGRMNDNDLIFADQPRVSRHHCVLMWNGESGKYQITDHSSNGCYVNNMKDCIPHNIAIDLMPGTILDIGNENNRFRLE